MSGEQEELRLSVLVTRRSSVLGVTLPGCSSACPRCFAGPGVSDLSSPRTFHLSSSSISTHANGIPKPTGASLTSRTSPINATMPRVALWLACGQLLSLVLTDYHHYRPCSQGASCSQPAPPPLSLAVTGSDPQLRSWGLQDEHRQGALEGTVVDKT